MSDYISDEEEKVLNLWSNDPQNWYHIHFES